MLIEFLKRYRLNYRKKTLRAGVRHSRFVAHDIRREVEVVESSEIDQGFITAKVRTWNVLYAIKEIATMPEFGEPKRIRIDNLWDWKGAPWGGPVADDEAEPKS